MENRMKLNHLPMFDVTLPVSKEKVKFRPFVMKEEKLLLMAAESQDVGDVFNALEQSITACTDGKVSCETHPMVDIQYLFLQVRGKSVGEELEFNLLCGKCNHKVPKTLDISSIGVEHTPNHTNKFFLSNDVSVTMMYPKIRHLGILSQENATLDDIYDVVAECIESINTSEEVYDRSNSSDMEFRNFVDNLTSQQFVQLKEFFDTMPAIRYQILFDCPACETKNRINLDDIVNFFG